MESIHSKPGASTTHLSFTADPFCTGVLRKRWAPEGDLDRIVTGHLLYVAIAEIADIRFASIERKWTQHSTAAPAPARPRAPVPPLKIVTI